MRMAYILIGTATSHSALLECSLQGFVYLFVFTEVWNAPLN